MLCFIDQLHATQKRVQKKRKKRTYSLSRGSCCASLTLSDSDDEMDAADEYSKPLIKRLDASQVSADVLIPPALLRKYIAYARKYVSPRLSKEAATVLRDFYISLRKKYRSTDSTPITTRQVRTFLFTALLPLTLPY